MINSRIYLILYPPKGVTASVLHAYYTFRELQSRLGKKCIIIYSSRGIDEIKNLYYHLYPIDLDKYHHEASLQFYRRRYIFKYFKYYIDETLFAFKTIFYLIKSRIGNKTIIYTQNLISAFWITLLLSRIFRVKVIYEEHSLDKVDPFFPKYNLLEKIIKEYSIKNVHHLVTLSSASKKEIIRRNLKFFNKITTVPIGFPSIFKPLDKKRCRKKLGFSLQGKILIYAGITFSYRNLKFLIDAFNGIKQNNIKLVLVGGYQLEIDKLIREFDQINSNILFTGRKNHSMIPLFLNSADALIIHATLHGRNSAPPQKLFEYMAVNRPIICPKQANLNEFLKGNAFFFEKGDQKSFQNAIISSVTNIKEASTKARIAYLNSRKYTYKLRIEKLLKVFKTDEN